MNALEKKKHFIYTELSYEPPHYMYYEGQY